MHRRERPTGGQPAHGSGLRRLVLENVPVLGELAVFEADDVGGDPGGRAAVARESDLGDDGRACPFFSAPVRYDLRRMGWRPHLRRGRVSMPLPPDKSRGLWQS
jgi:hypothetical protein